MFKRVVVLAMILCIVSPWLAQSQDITSHGYFLEDSLRIGEKTPFILTAKYPKDRDVIFPDSLYNFSPWELDEKWYAPTRSDEEFSYDSAIYYLTSFEIDSIQYYQMPVFLLNNGDSITFSTARDSIVLRHMVTEIPDSVTAEAMPLKENTTYKRVGLEFNYPYFIIGMAILAILIVALYLIFGKSIRKTLLIRRLTRTHRKFLQHFEMLKASKSHDRERAEAILSAWKKYLEKLENRPYTKSTTKEIIQNYKSDTIRNALRGLDKTIYSDQTNGELAQSFEDLRRFSEERFHQKVQEVKNG